MAEQIEADVNEQEKGEGDDQDLHQLHGTGVKGLLYGEPLRVERLQIMDLLHRVPADG